MLLFLSMSKVGYSQLNELELSKRVTITVKDLLDLRFQTLSAQLSSGSLKIHDLGRFSFPVSIRFEKDMRIVFEIEGNLEEGLSRTVQEDVMKEGMVFVNTAISLLIQKHFGELSYDGSKDVIGNWSYKNRLMPCAKWENNEFVWLNDYSK